MTTSKPNEARAEIEEVSSTLTPEKGVSVYDAIRDAQLAGYARIEVDEARNVATITWFKKERAA